MVPSKSFQKTYKKFVTKRPILKGFIETALIKLEEDAFSPDSKSHKLSGNLCRIIFSIEKDIKSKVELIFLIDIGTHDKVY